MSKLKTINEVGKVNMNWIELNNQVIIKDEQGKYQLEKDKEALECYINEYVTPKLKNSIT